jgi:hypothetical protein
MSLSERIQQLNEAIGSSVERSIVELREEIQRRIGEITPRLPASFLSQDDFAPHEREVGSTARQTAFSELRDGIAAVDRARTQADILTALLRESSRHASRAALLLVRGGELRGWGSEGFGGAEAAVRELALNPQAGAWSRLLESTGALRLSAAECAELCGRIEAPLPRDGVLIPLVLRDRVAAGLYADRLGDARDTGLDVEALQILAHTAALGIETLPFRERAETPTLSLAGGETAAEATESPAPTSATPAPVNPAPAAAEPAAAVAAPVAEPAPPAAHHEPEMPEMPELEVEPDEPEPASGAPWTVEDEQSAVSLDAAEALDETAPASSSHYTEELSLDSIAAASSSAASAAAEAAASGGQASPLATQRAAGAMTEDVPRYPRSVEPEAPPAQPKDTSPDATVLLQRSALPLADISPPAPLRPVPVPEPAPFERPAAAAPAAGTPEVRPPSGVDGPGWAFATTRVPVSPNEEALHEEARRLARLLVSEIKLYNEEQVEEGRRNRDIYERLKEDIDRSRQMYDERVDPRILRSTDYFYQELVRILASGDSRALGI